MVVYRMVGNEFKHNTAIIVDDSCKIRNKLYTELTAGNVQVLCRLSDFVWNDQPQIEAACAVQALGVLFVGDDQHTSALGAGCGEWFFPRGKVAARIILTPIEDTSPAGFPLDEFSAILRAFHIDLFQPWLCIAAFREIAAADKFPISSPTDYQLMTALRALASYRLGSIVHLRDELFRPADLLRERSVELPDNLRPLLSARGYFIQVFLHLGGKINVDDIGEMLCN